MEPQYTTCIINVPSFALAKPHAFFTPGFIVALPKCSVGSHNDVRLHDTTQSNPYLRHRISSPKFLPRALLRCRSIPKHPIFLSYLFDLDSPRKRLVMLDSDISNRIMNIVAPYFTPPEVEYGIDQVRQNIMFFVLGVFTFHAKFSNALEPYVHELECMFQANQWQKAYGRTRKWYPDQRMPTGTCLVPDEVSDLSVYSLEIHEDISLFCLK